MNTEKIKFQNQYCNERECLPLAEAIRETLSIVDYYQPECFILKYKQWGNFAIKAYYRVNGSLFYATAKMDTEGNILEKKINAKATKAATLKIAV